MTQVRVRFAPSPTGKVHIGNIRTAIFDWLYARHTGGKFLLRVEDTDKQRSTQEAIDALFDCMKWLGIDYDEEVYYQSAHEAEHRADAERLVASGAAYRLRDVPAAESPVIFRIPWNTDGMEFVRTAGEMTIDVAPGTAVEIDYNGIKFAQAGQKGTPVERSSCLAGFKDLVVTDATGKVLFELTPAYDAVAAGKRQVVEGAAKLRFTRREVVYKDIVKGELSKPLDSMKDLVIVRTDGSPVFHLANVCDDVAQRVTHIVRGDDHVENTYRHILLFHALGYPTPQYAHLPMIVNDAGKPFSKRDGDAFVGDFRLKGYLPDALFNYLALLGWSPGDDREKMTRDEMIQAFTLDRVKSSPAKFDTVKLLNLNGMYIAELKQDDFLNRAWDRATEQGWTGGVDRAYFNQVGTMLQSRTKILTHVAEWRYFFTDDYEIDEKAVAKFLGKPEPRVGVAKTAELLNAATEFTLESIEKAIREAERIAGLGEGKLNQPLRIAVTGRTTGAGVYETIHLLGKERAAKRLAAAAA